MRGNIIKELLMMSFAFQRTSHRASSTCIPRIQKWSIVFEFPQMSNIIAFSDSTLS